VIRYKYFLPILPAMKYALIFGLALIVILLAGCTTKMANPASTYCIEQGGKLEIRSNEQGQYGVCIMPTGECEEWAFYRNECTPEE